jgi:hypothetical protein
MCPYLTPGTLVIKYLITSTKSRLISFIPGYFYPNVLLNLFQHPTGQVARKLNTKHMGCRNKFGTTFNINKL